MSCFTPVASHSTHHASRITFHAQRLFPLSVVHREKKHPAPAFAAAPDPQQDAVAFGLLARGHRLVRAADPLPLDLAEYVARAQPGLRGVGVLIHLADQRATNVARDVSLAPCLSVEIGYFNPV